MTQVLIYVRLPRDRDKTRRIVSFDLPEDIAAEEIFELGGAIDGRQALFEVEYPFRQNALLNLERRIVAMLKGHEYSVDFR